jgi:hypothetical protein
VEKLSEAFLILPRIQIKWLLVLLNKMILKMSFVSLSIAGFTVSQVKIPINISMLFICTLILHAAGVKSIRKQRIRADMTKVIVEPERKNCPRIDQIHLVSVFNVAAKGPADARALTRKIIGNQEYCLQIDAHTKFRAEWDKEAIDQWKMIGNEFAILSTVPADLKEESEYEGWTGSKKGEVPRQCLVKIPDETPVSAHPHHF